jgi:signal transduction histidine kinase
MSPYDSAYTFFSTGHTLLNAALVEDLLRSIFYRQDRSIGYRVAVESAQVDVATENLRIILEELLDNACKFSTANQQVQITGYQAAGQYVLTIINDGQPFNATDIERVEAYRQFERGHYEQQGFGLGLAITKKILTLNNGSLCIDSLASGETQVRVYLANP